MTDRQAALEQVAREWLIARGWCHLDASYQRVAVQGDVVALADLLAAQRAEVLEQTYEQTITAAIREADRVFEKVGGSTRHYVRDCLLPIMKKHGLIVVRDRSATAGPRGIAL